MRFFLIDHVREFEADKRVLAVKNVTLESQHFDQHFPGMPLLPGALLIESMAQASGYLIARSARERDGRILLTLLAGIPQARFLKPVLPGDQVLIESRLQLSEGHLGKAQATATVGGAVVARAGLSFALKEYKGEPQFAAAVAQFDAYRRILERDIESPFQGGEP